MSPTRAFHHQRTAEYLSRRSVSSSSDLLQNKLRKLLNDQGPNRSGAPLSIFQQPIEPIESPTRIASLKFKSISQSPKRKNPEVRFILDVLYRLWSPFAHSDCFTFSIENRLSYRRRLRTPPIWPHSFQVHSSRRNRCRRKMSCPTRTARHTTTTTHCSSPATRQLARRRNMPKLVRRIRTVMTVSMTGIYTLQHHNWPINDCAKI